MSMPAPSASVTVQPGMLSDDRWTQERCAQNKRVIDVNHFRSQVRYWCERCRVNHTVDIGVRYTNGNL